MQARIRIPYVHFFPRKTEKYIECSSWLWADRRNMSSRSLVYPPCSLRPCSRLEWEKRRWTLFYVRAPLLSGRSPIRPLGALYTHILTLCSLFFTLVPFSFLVLIFSAGLWLHWTWLFFAGLALLLLPLSVFNVVICELWVSQSEIVPVELKACWHCWLDDRQFKSTKLWCHYNFFISNRATKFIFLKMLIYIKYCGLK